MAVDVRVIDAEGDRPGTLHDDDKVTTAPTVRRADAYQLQPGDTFTDGPLKGRTVSTNPVRYYVPFPGYYAAQVFLVHVEGTTIREGMLREGVPIDVIPAP